MYGEHICNECGREKRFKRFGSNWIVTRALGMNGGKVNRSGVRCDLDCCASELGLLAGCCYHGNEPAVVLVGHFDQLSDLMLVLTYAFYIFIVVFFSLSVITVETLY